MNDEDEVLDIVDENDIVVGKKTRTEIYNLGLRNFRVVNAFLVNSKGEVWILRRSPNEDMFPRGLDLSVGGHVSSGESYEEALKREAKEELDIDVDKTKCSLIAYLSPYTDGASAFTKLYSLESDVTPVINPDEFIDGFWIYPDVLIEKVKGGEPSKGDLLKMLQLYCSR